MSDDSVPSWSDALQRRVIMLAVADDLPRRLPDAFSARLFGPSESRAGRPTSPRARIAGHVEAYWKTYLEMPGTGIMNDIITADLLKVQDAERQAVVDEWEAIKSVSDGLGRDCVLRQVQEWIERRRLEQSLLEAANALARGSYSDAVTAVQRGCLPVTGISTEGTSLFELAREDIQRFWIDEDAGIHVPTGFAALDSLLDGGPTKGEFHVVLAPPKGAKTSFLVNVALGAARRRWGVFLATFEMRSRRMRMRLHRGMARAGRRVLREDPSIIRRAFQGMRAVGAGDIHVIEASPQQAKACVIVADQVRDLRRRGAKIDVVVLDYLNIMGASQQEREKRHELARIARDMSALAKDLDVVVWSAGLVNRQAMDTKYPKKSDIAESYEVVAVADGVYAIFADKSMRSNRQKGLHAVALREAEDERRISVYRVDLDRLVFEEERDDEPDPEPGTDEGSEVL